jgi:heme oxygenase
MSPILAVPTTSRAARLRAHTHSLHERLDHRIIACKPFQSRERYGLFLQVQQPFLQLAEAAYRDPALNASIPGLASKARLSLIEQDMQDLGVTPRPVEARPFSTGEALGWLYVAEGSNLGAAILLKHAQKLGLTPEFGARHLAGHPDGRGLNWRRFIGEFDAIRISEEAEREADAAAADAFAFVQDRVGVVFEDEANARTNINIALREAVLNG